MNISKIFISAVLAASLALVGCAAEKGNTTKNQEDIKVKVEDGNTVKNGDDVKSEEGSQDLKYNISKEVLENEAKNTKIFYPQVVEYPGELLKDYMNQSLKKISDIYANEDQYTDVKIDYEITKMDGNILSVLFKGTGKIKEFGEINIQHSVNLDINTSNEITYNNLIKDNEESKKAVMNILDKKAKEKGIEEGMEAEGVRIYFKGEEIVFYYMPLDDTAKEFVELNVPKKELEGYINTTFGEAPAS